MDSATQLFKAFADPTRLRLLHLMAHRGPRICVCDLMEVLQLPQSTISRQMAPLRMLGLVQARRSGTWMLYSLADPRGELHETLLRSLGCCAAQGEGFGRDLARYDELVEARRLACCRGIGGAADVGAVAADAK